MLMALLCFVPAATAAAEVGGSRRMQAKTASPAPKPPSPPSPPPVTTVLAGLISKTNAALGSLAANESSALAAVQSQCDARILGNASALGAAIVANATSVRSALESELQNKVNELRNALLDDNMNMLNRVIGTLRSQLTPPVCKVPGTVMISTVDASQGWTIDGPPQPAMVYTVNGWQCVCELGGGGADCGRSLTR